jgi:hypothetical protein
LELADHVSQMLEAGPGVSKNGIRRSRMDGGQHAEAVDRCSQTAKSSKIHRVCILHFAFCIQGVHFFSNLLKTRGY